MVFKKPKKVYVAYADSKGGNEMLIRDGRNFFVLTSQKDIFPISASDASRILKLVKEQVLQYRGSGSFVRDIEVSESFGDIIKNYLKGAIQ